MIQLAVTTHLAWVIKF